MFILIRNWSTAYQVSKLIDQQDRSGLLQSCMELWWKIIANVEEYCCIRWSSHAIMHLHIRWRWSENGTGEVVCSDLRELAKVDSQRSLGLKKLCFPYLYNGHRVTRDDIEGSQEKDRRGEMEQTIWASMVQDSILFYCRCTLAVQTSANTLCCLQTFH